MSVQLELIKTKNIAEAIIMVFISVFFAFLAIGIFVGILVAFGGLEVNTGELIKFAFLEIASSPQAWLQVLYWATPLMLTGLAVAIAFQAGLFNIGGQGQMMIGAVASAIWSAAIVPDTLPFLNHRILMIPTTILVGFIAGGFWGYVPGVLKAKTGAHEVIVTIMMNLIAISTITYLVGSQSYSPYIDKSSLDAYAQTDLISTKAQYSALFPEINRSFNITTILTILILIIFHLVVYYSNFGFKLRAVGFNKKAAETAGIKSDRVVILSMTLAGGVAGLAGTFIVMGPIQYRYVGGFEGTLGFDGIAVALIAQNSPLPIVLAALFFGFLKQSKNSLDVNTTIPPDLIFALQAFVIIFIAAPTIARYVYRSGQDVVRSAPDKEEVIT